MKKILVTGGCGFVGRHLIHRLLDRGDEVNCVDPLLQCSGAKLPSEWDDFAPFDYRHFNFYEQDCRDFFLENLDDDFDEVYHLAAIVGGRLMIENHPLAVADDLAIDSLFWQWCLKTNPAKVIAFSSSAVYPTDFQSKDDYHLLREDMVSMPKGRLGFPDLSYGWSKLSLEFLANIAFERHGIKSVVFRPFSGYGEDQNKSYPFKSLITKVMNAYHYDGSKPVSVWGSGEQRRDWIHIEDCIDGILKISPKINDASPVNLSTGRYTSFKEFIRIAAKIKGYEPCIQADIKMPEGVFARAGCTNLQKYLGFEPKISLEDGIKKAMEAPYENG